MGAEQLQLDFVFNEASLSGAPRILSFTQALALFDRMADRQDIAFGYAQDGCYARAHLMCQQMIAEGHKPKKAWAFEGDKSMYVVHPNGERTYWCYHVSAALPVQMPDGSVQDLVFDPGLFDGPVTLEKWGDTMHAPRENLEITDFGVAPKGKVGDYEPKYQVSTTPDTDNIAMQCMQNYMKWNGNGPRQVFATEMRALLKDVLGLALRQGLTWTSVITINPVSDMMADAAAGMKQKLQPEQQPEQLKLPSIPKQAPGTVAALGEKFGIAAENAVSDVAKASTGLGARVKKLWNRMVG